MRLLGRIMLSVTVLVAGVSAQTPSQKKVATFELNQVTLLAGPFKSAMERKCNYLRFLNSNRLLYSFRATNKLPTQGATQYGGWESMAIRGHTLGHVLSALAQAYQATGDERYKAKADTLVTELQKCQNAAVSAGFTSGYLAAIPESDVNTLLNLGNIWAPLYNIHKTFAGLLDCHRLLNNAAALEVATKLGDWAYNKLSPYNHAKYQQFWDNRQSAAGEFGGFNESLAELYRITGTQKYLTAAHYFDHDKLFNPCLNNQDGLNGLHANTSIPEIIGALKIYEVSGDANSYTIARNFFKIVIDAHTYANGGNSENEYFKAPDAIASLLTDKTCETCNVYNMLKLARQLFLLDPQTNYMDYYERALYNQILASQDTGSVNGHCTYFQPLRSGGQKTYGNDEGTFYCCDGTGLESHTKYGENIFFHAGDTLLVNLFIASQLNWTDKNMTVRMETAYPQSDTVRLTITGSGSMPLKVRAPFWLQQPVSVSVDNVPQSVSAEPGTYFTINKSWNGTGVVTIVLPQTLRFEKTPDKVNVGAVLYGAQLLAGDYGTTNLSAMPSLNASTVKKTSSFPLKFTGTASTGTVTLAPFFQMQNQRYSVYWNLTDIPTVAVAKKEKNIGRAFAPREISWRSGCLMLRFSERSARTMPITVSLFTLNGARLGNYDVTVHEGEYIISLPIPESSVKMNFIVCKVAVAGLSSSCLVRYARNTVR